METYEIILALIIDIILIGGGVFMLNETFTKRDKSMTNEKILGLFLSFIFFSIAIAIMFIIIKIN